MNVKSEFTLRVKTQMILNREVRMIKRYIITILLVLFLASPVFAADYFVAQSSAGSANGTSYANRANVTYHNNGTGVFGSLDGDTVYLCDTITSRVIPPDSGSSGSGYITYRGDYAGHAGIVNYESSGSSMFRIDNKDYIIVDGIEFDGNNAAGEMAFGIDDSSYIEIKNCKIYEMDLKGILLNDSDHVTIGGASGDGNEIYNIGKGKNSGEIDIAMSDSGDIIISYNKLYATSTTWGQDGILMENCNDVLMEYNTIYSHNLSGSYHGEDGIDIKINSRDIIARYNHIYDHQEQSGITVQMGSYNVQIYGNSIHGNKWGGVYIKRGNEGSHDMYNINVWSNLLWGNGSGVAISSHGGSGPDDLDDVRIYNNVLAENGNWQGNSSSRAGVCIHYGSGHIVKNNAFYKNHGLYGGNTYEQVYVHSTGAATFEENFYHYPGRDQDDDFAWMSTTARDLAEWNAYAWVDGEEEDDLVMTDEDANDYTLAAGSPLIDSGDDLGNNYDDALNPLTTDFSTHPPTPVRADQHTWGDGWEKGAFAYPTSGITVTVSATDDTATEESTTTGEWTIACSPNCAGETINYAFSGTADLNDDYNCDDEDGTIAITGASDTITLTPVDDAVQDVGEVAILTINVGTGYAVGSPSNASITIEDNDGAQEAGVSGITVDASGSGKVMYDPSGSGSWAR